MLSHYPYKFLTRQSAGDIPVLIYHFRSTKTKRFRVYRRVLTTYFSEEKYLHYQTVEKSAYALIRKSTIENNPHIIEEISTYFSDNYTDFD